MSEINSIAINSNAQEKLNRFNQLIAEVEAEYRFVASIEGDLLKIQVENSSNESEGASLMEFTEAMRDRLIDAAIASNIPKVKLQCGGIQYPAFDPARLKELSIRYEQQMKNIRLLA